MSHPEKTPLTIQINSLPALERLLGDSEQTYTLAVRNAVAQAFANRHLNALEKSEIVKEAVREARQKGDLIRDQIRKDALLALGAELGTLTKQKNYPHWLEFTLSPEMREQITRAARQAAAGLVQGEIDKIIAVMDIPGMIREGLIERVNKEWVRSVDDEIKRRIDEIKKLL